MNPGVVTPVPTHESHRNQMNVVIGGAIGGAGV